MWSVLEQATRDCHAIADEPWLALVTDLSVRAYRDHLATVYGFEAPLEAAFALTPGLALVVDLRARARSSWLVQDLFELGMRPTKLARLPQSQSILPFRDVIDALGWLYVVERSTPFHQLLATEVARELPNAPLTFLSTRGFEMRKSAFEGAVERVATDRASRERIVDAAREAFACQREWFEGPVRISSPSLVAIR